MSQNKTSPQSNIVVNKPNIITLAKPTTATAGNTIKQQTASIIQLNSSNINNSQQTKIVTFPNQTTKINQSDEFTTFLNSQNNDNVATIVLNQAKQPTTTTTISESELDDIMSSLQTNESIKTGKSAFPLFFYENLINFLVFLRFIKKFLN